MFQMWMNAAYLGIVNKHVSMYKELSNAHVSMDIVLKMDFQSIAKQIQLVS